MASADHRERETSSRRPSDSPGPSQLHRQAGSGGGVGGLQSEVGPVPSKRMKSEKRTSVLCTYCDGGVPALKTCLQCEASFCAKHLEKHKMLPGHVLTKPTASLAERKCSKHQEVLKYHCKEDGALICQSCCLTGEHIGHNVDSLDVYAEKKKERLKKFLQDLKLKLQNIENLILTEAQHNQSQKRKAEEIKDKVTTKMEHIMRELEDLKGNALSELSMKITQASHLGSHRIEELKAQKTGIIQKIEALVGLSNLTDPLMFLIMKGKLNVTAHTFSSPPSADQKRLKISGKSILQKLQYADAAIKQLLDGGQTTQEILLDKETVHCDITISGDSRTASWNPRYSFPGAEKERFQSPQVMSVCSFSSGSHYWEVDLKGTKKCIIGVAYRSLVQMPKGPASFIGRNDKSWGLYTDPSGKRLFSCKSNQVRILNKSPVASFGISLKYESGRISFYQLTNPRRHLHSFSATFTEPLHACFYLYKGCVISIRKRKSGFRLNSHEIPDISSPSSSISGDSSPLPPSPYFLTDVFTPDSD